MSEHDIVNETSANLCELFAEYGSGGYNPSEEEFGIIQTGVELEILKVIHHARKGMPKKEVGGDWAIPLPPELTAKLAKPKPSRSLERSDFSSTHAWKVFNDMKEELALTDKLLEERQAVIDLIPWCKAHGKGCLSHAKDWINEAAGYMGEEIEVDQTQLEFNSYTNGFAVRHRGADFEVRIGGGRTIHANRGACLRALQYHLKTSGEGRS